jgi:hypothetical protein
MPRFDLAPDYGRIKLVHSFQALLDTPLTDGVNALCWQRDLPGDFNEVVASLPRRDGLGALGASAAQDGSGSGITPIKAAQLKRLRLSEAGRMAADIMHADLRLLQRHGQQPSLDRIDAYARDRPTASIATDVHSFHVDSAPQAACTWLCAYTGAASQGLRNDQAQKHIDIPATRAALLQAFGGADDEAFLDFLSEHCYDLHYAPLPQAKPFDFGLGNLWKIAIEYPGNPVPPCIHRAPESLPGLGPRLLLIA